MATYTRQFNKVKNSAGFNLSAEFNVDVDKKEANYLKFINNTFSSHSRVSFKEAVQIKTKFSLSKGSLCYKECFNGQIKLFITKEEISSKISLRHLDIIDPAISPEYLLWFLSHKQVKDYLMHFSLGIVITHIPIETFNLLDIPYPKLGKTRQKKTTIILKPENSKFKALISQYYQHYKDNYHSENYLTAAILAGAIVETHLFVFLTDSGIPQNILQQKTLGKLIELAEIYLLNCEIDDFPLSDFKEVQKLRNRAVHPIINADSYKEINEGNFSGFERIVKYFGL